MIHWARFFRIPLLPTVWCHLYAAAMMVDQNFLDHPWLIVAFSCVYLFGMGDNDRVDLARDLENNPSRPLAAGHIRLSHATIVLTLLLAIGALSVCMIKVPHQSVMVALSLGGAWLYNRVFKSIAVAGALCLAVCRAAIYYSYDVDLLYVGILGGYTALITLWSYTEEEHPQRKKITLLLLLLLPLLDFILLTFEKGLLQQAIFLLPVIIVCRMMVLALSPKKKITVSE